MHVEHAVPGTDVLLWLAVTIQAPLHIEGVLGPHEGHLVDGTMTAGASDPLGDMDVMPEVDEVGQVVNPVPLDRLLVAPRRANGFEIRCLCPDERMTRHTRLDGGNACKGRLLDRGMTISAVDPKSLDMVLVAERHRLIDRDTDLVDILDTIDVQNDAEQQPRHADDGNDGEPCKPIATAMKNLRHLRTHSRMVTSFGGTPQGRGRLIPGGGQGCRSKGGNLR